MVKYQSTGVGSSVQGSEIDIPSETRGDILFRNASEWARLPKGTQNQILTMGANDPAWGAGGGWSVVEQDSITGSASTELGNFASLDIATDGTYMIIWQAKADGGSSVTLDCEANTDNTASNYKNNRTIRDGSSISTAVADGARVGTCTTGASATAGIIFIHKDAVHRYRYNAFSVGKDATPFIEDYGGMSDSAVSGDNITSLELQGNNTMSVGGTATLYKLSLT